MLRYIGNGRALPDVPARDLTDEEVAQHGEEFLLSIKPPLYEQVKAPKKGNADLQAAKEVADKIEGGY